MIKNLPTLLIYYTWFPILSIRYLIKTILVCCLIARVLVNALRLPKFCLKPLFNEFLTYCIIVQGEGIDTVGIKNYKIRR